MSLLIFAVTLTTLAVSSALVAIFSPDSFDKLNTAEVTKRAAQTITAARAVNPIGAAAIFAIAYLAGFAGSLPALLIAAALFAGLYLAGRSAELTTAPVAAAASPTTIVGPAAAITAPVGPSSPLADALAAGLQIRKIEFAGPQSARVKVVSQKA